jgi:methyl-accepting chemotaxis protein
MSKLFKRTLLLMVALFGIIATGTSIVSAWNLYHELTEEYQSKGTAIAKGIADSSVEVLLNRDASTVQAIVDQFTEIEGVSYVLVTDRSGDIVSHTFVPGVPKQILKIQSADRNGHKGLTTTYLDIDGIGGVIDISAPILAGVAGHAHVGMDRTLIRAQIWKAVMEQQGLMLLIFLASVLIAYALVNRISQPLNLLAGHARSLAAADFSAGVTVPPEIDALANRTTDEIGNLARSFSSMERALDQSIRHLSRAS